MATAGGGGKIRSKRQHGAGKPYARNKGLLGRVTDNVKNLIPSWLQSYFRTDDSTAAGAAPPTSSAPSRSPSSSLDPEEARPAPLDGFSFAGLNHDAQQNCEVAGDGAKPSTSTAATSGYTYTVPFPRTRGPQKRQPIDRLHATQHGSLALQSWLPAAGNAAGPKPGDARDVPATGREAGVGSGSASAVATGTRSGQTMPVLSGADGVARDVRDSSSQCEDDSVSTTSGFSSRASDKDVSMQPRGSAVLLQPLWCMGAELPARSTPQPSAHSAKKPSFNLTVFDSSRTAGGLGSGQRGESTFYAGKTTYGGASAMSRPSQRKLPAAPYQAPYRVQVKAKPATPRLTSAVTSVTARRILQSLEKLSSPLSDALKIPSSNTSPSLSGSSYLDPVSSLRAHRLQPQRPPVQQLVTPRAAAVSSSRSLYRRSWAGPSRTASPSPSTTTTAVAQSSLASDSTQPGTSCDNRTLQSSKASLPGPPKALAELATPVANGLPRGGGGSGGGGGGKMKRERIAVHFSAQKDDESESDVALPSVPLPIRAGALPSFSFGPVATSTPANTRAAALAAAAAIGSSSTGAGGGGGSGSTDKMPFAFTTPPVKATEIEQPPTSQSPPFQFSTPVTKAGLVTTPTTLPSSGTGFAFRLPSATQSTPVPSVGVVAAGAAVLSGHKERSGGTTSPAGDLKGSKGMSKRSNDEDNDSGGGPFKAAKTLKSGSVLDILMASSAPKGPGLGEAAAASGASGGEVRPTASGFGDRFRPPEGSWECNACMVQNQASHVTCVACQASKPTPKRATAPSSIPAANAKSPQAAGPSLAEQFAAPPGSWDCDTCMVSNRGESSRCVACDTPRAGLAPKRSALAPPLSTSSSSSAASTFFSSGVSTAPASITRAPASSAPPPAYTKPSAAAGGASSLASLFVRPEGAWDCDVCMVQNKAGSGSCAACQTAKPGGKAPMSSAAPAATPVGFGDKFKRPVGSWDCDTCMVSNSASTDVCACCSTERPGAARPTAAQAPAQPDRPTFSFGLSSDDSAASALPSAAATFSFNSQGGFKFGTGSTSASKDTTTTTPSSTAGASGVTDTSGPAAAARGFTFGTTAPANDSTVTFGGGFKLPSSDAAETAQTSAATFTFGTKVGAGNSTVSAAATTTDSSAAAAASTAKMAEPKGPSGGTFQFGVATPSFGQNALAGGADASKLGAGFAFAPDKEAAPATFGGFQFKTSGAAEQPAATATFGAFGGVKRSDGAGPEGKAVPPLATGFSFSKEAAQKTDADEPTAKKPFGFATMNPSAAATPGLFGAAAPAPTSSAAAPASGSSFSFGTKPIAFGVPVKPDAPAANAGPSTSIGAAPPFMFGPAASVSAAKPDPAATGAAPACSSAQIAPFGFAPSAKLDKPTTTFLFGPGHESQQQQLAGTAANNSATPVAPFVFGKTDAGVTTATNAAAAPPVFGAVPKTDAPAANSGVAGAPGSGGSTFMFGPSAGSAASAATAAVTPFGFGGVTGAASSSGAGFGSGSSSIFSAPGSSLPTFGTASSAPPAGAAHAFGTQPGSSGGGDGGGGPGGAPFRQQPPTQPPAFGSSGPSQLAPPAFGFSANQQQAPAFGSGAAPAGGQQPLFSAAVQKPAFGPGGAAGQPAGSGSFQFSGAAPAAAAAAQGFNFGAASPAPGPSGSSLTFGGSPQQAPGTFQFNARPGFNIGMSGSPANQFQGSSSATLKNRKYKTAVRRRK